MFFLNNKTHFRNKPYNPYNPVPNTNKFKVGSDLEAVKKNFQRYKPEIVIISRKMFWLSIAITLSFVISQVYLLFSQ